MEIFNVKFTSAQMKNLATFLSRVQLTGAEAPAFQEILVALGSPEVETTKTPTKKKDE